jgi:hypothetical protein
MLEFKSKKAPAFTSADDRAKTGANGGNPGFPPAGWSTIRTQRIEGGSSSSCGSSGSSSGSGRGCKFSLHLSNLFLHLLQESFGSHGRIDSVRLASVNGRGLRIRLLSSNV